MLKLERQRLILEHIRRKGSVSVRDAANVLGTAEATVRRDLVALAWNGLVKRTHGGAVLPQGLNRELAHTNQLPPPGPADVELAIVAANLIQPGDSIILGPGMAILALAREITAVPNLTVITNSLLICEALKDANAIEVFLTGGSLRRSTMSLVGPSAEQSLHGLRAATAFLSGSGLTAQNGLSAESLATASADRALASAAGRIVALVSDEKVGRDALCQVVPCAAIQVLITRANADHDELRLMTQLGVDVRLATTDDRSDFDGFAHNQLGWQDQAGSWGAGSGSSGRSKYHVGT